MTTGWFLLPCPSSAIPGWEALGYTKMSQSLLRTSVSIPVQWAAWCYSVPLTCLDNQAGSQEKFPFCSAGGLFPLRMARRLGSGWVPFLGSVRPVMLILEQVQNIWD